MLFVTVAPSLSPPASPGRPALPSATLLPSAGCTLQSPAGVGRRGQPLPASDRASELPASTSPVKWIVKGNGTSREEGRALCVTSSWGTVAAPRLKNSFPNQVKRGSPTGHWVAISDYPGEGSEGEKDQNWASEASSSREIHWEPIPGS